MYTVPDEMFHMCRMSETWLVAVGACGKYFGSVLRKATTLETSFSI